MKSKLCILLVFLKHGEIDNKLKSKLSTFILLKRGEILYTGRCRC
jgi:hypothetical protein